MGYKVTGDKALAVGFMNLVQGDYSIKNHLPKPTKGNNYI